MLTVASTHILLSGEDFKITGLWRIASSLPFYNNRVVVGCVCQSGSIYTKNAGIYW